ncbi:major facilitator superfamily domain-containing protein [Dipodascopsis tothii]|uniref:major facilitator superfamily domain-containing protein n=1 Tax=Dipodascopsis tothii TaxID=44089 RepID=UPI0034CE5B8A
MAIEHSIEQTDSNVETGVVAEKFGTTPSTSKFCNTLGYVWDSFGKPTVEERVLCLKLDVFVFGYGILCYIVKTLDTTNISNAYVSGMKEDLALYGNELNLMSTYFTVGYMAGAVPAQIAMNRIRPSIFVPSCQIFWTVFVMIMAKAQSAKLIYGCRFVIGVAEAVLFPSIAWLIGSWYRSEELGKRIVMFELANQIAAMFSGYLQAGVYTSMNGAHGLAGWRWLFIIDGVISIPIAVFAFFALPDFPSNTRALWLTAEQRDLAIRRMLDVGRAQPKPMTVRSFFAMFRNWRLWTYIGPYGIPPIASSSGYFNLFLKASGHYTVQQINIIPTAGNAISIVYGFAFSWISDRTGTRWQWILLSLIPAFVGDIMLAVWTIPFNAKMCAYLLLYASSASQPLALVWGAETFRDSAETRGMAIAFGDMCINAMYAWVPLLAFPTVEAPHYRVGYKLSAALLVAQAASVLFFLYMSKREA